MTHRRRSLFLTAACAVLCLAAVAAQAQKRPQAGQTPSPAQPAPVQPAPAQPVLPQPRAAAQLPCPAPAVVADSLPNGLRVLFVRVNDLPLVELNLVIDAGSGRDPVSKDGVALLAARTTLARTAQRGRDETARAFAALGSSISTAAGSDHAQLYVRALARNFARTVDLMADLCVNGSAGERDVSSEIRSIAAQAARVPVQAGEMTTLTALTLLAGEGDALVRSARRPPRDLTAISAADVLAFRRAWYLPNNATLVVTGAVDPAVAMTVIGDRFGAWQRGTPPLEPAPPQAPGREPGVTLIDAQSVKMAPLRIAWDAPSRASADFPALLVLNAMLGSGTQSILSRLFWFEHRVHPGFVSSVGGTAARSYLIVGGFSAPVTIDSVFLFLDAAVDGLCAGRISAADCDTAKRMLLDGGEFDFSTNKRAQSMLQELVVNRLPASPPDRMTSGIRAVTPEDVARVARTVFRGAPPAVAVYGNSELLVPGLQRRFGRNVHVVRPPAPEGERAAPAPSQPPSPPDQR